MAAAPVQHFHSARQHIALNISTDTFAARLVMGNAESSVTRPNGARSIGSSSAVLSAAEHLRKSLEGEYMKRSSENVRKSVEVQEDTPAEGQQEDFGESRPTQEVVMEMPGGSLVPSAQVDDPSGTPMEEVRVEGYQTQPEQAASSEPTVAKPDEVSSPTSELPKVEEAPQEQIVSTVIHGTYTLVSVKADTAAMDLSGGDNKSVISFPVHGAANQQWSLMPLAHGPEHSYTIRSTGSGLYLTIEPDARTGAVRVVANEFPASWDVEEIYSGPGGQDKVVRIGWPKSSFAVGFAKDEGDAPGHKVQLVAEAQDQQAPNCLWKLIPSTTEHEPKHSDWHVSPHGRSSTESTVVEQVEREQQKKRTETVVTTTTTTTVKTTDDGTIITTVTNVSDGGLGGGGHGSRPPSGGCVVQ
ncbi:hypothetical protein OE88DRAFT_1520932 [Heliocybe sulcata]|uniref:Ricin B lectin domain-containing protein n=1 Tax=Heliocybe sulcata TaxID=5364 RepID=A0A5C3N1Z0_9AGAM|nr:hypothetical protein OE88DRAFT_1520932 [Heliocybe sulcata]